MNLKAVQNNIKRHGLLYTFRLKQERDLDKKKGKILNKEITRHISKGQTKEKVAYFISLVEKYYGKANLFGGEYIEIIRAIEKFCLDALNKEETLEDKEITGLLLFEYQKGYIERPFAKLRENSDSYKEAMRWYFFSENILRQVKGMDFPKLLSEMQALYVKQRYPAMYSMFSKEPTQNKVIFMENGNSPSPSSKRLVTTMKNQGKYEILTIGLHRRAVSELEYFENGLKLVKASSTAKAIFLSTANDIYSWIDLRPETKLIQLWHGVGMFKKVGWSTVDKQFGRGLAEREEYDQYRNYSYVTIAGKEQAWTFEDAMHIPADSGVIVPVGISRTDVFYDEGYFESIKKKLYTELPQIEGKKIILYVPTFRGSVRGAKAPDKLDVNLFGEALSDEYVLFIKHHGLSKDVPLIPEKWKDTFAFDMGEKKILGIESLLAVADICISDYSSIAFEYAILERPLIFFAYDMEEYLDARGMYYDYEEITPGPVCKTTEEMVDYILRINERFNKQEVIDFKNKYVEACDGHATERTIALIEN